MSLKSDNPKQIFVKWFPADYLSETGVVLSSLEENGLWVLILNLMMLTKGRLTLNDEPMPMNYLARLAHVSEERLEVLLKHLENVHLFSRDKHGIIFSRRLVRDYELFCTRSKAGTGGAISRYGKASKEFAIAKDITPSASASEYASDSASASDSHKEGGGGRSRKFHGAKRAETLWTKTKILLVETVDHENFETWIDPAWPLGHDKAKNGTPATLHVAAESEFKRSWLARNFSERVAKALEETTGSPCAVQFHVYERQTA